MTITVGLSIASDHIRAVGVRAGQIMWSLDAARAIEGDLAVEIVALLQHAQLPRWPRAVLAAAAQTKYLERLPEVDDRVALRSIVRESAPRFFLRNGIPLVVAGVRAERPGSAWAVAFDEPIVGAIERASRDLRLRIRLIAPTVVALGRGLDETVVLWADGDVRSELSFVERKLSSARRGYDIALPLDGASWTPPRVVDALRPLGADGWTFAAAYGVTQLPLDEPLALRSSAGDLDAGNARRGMRIAAAALAVASLAAIAAPAVANAVHSRRVGVRLAALGRRRDESASAEVELARISTALDEVEAFDISRRSPTALLSRLSAVMPDGSVLVTIRIDSVGGTVALLAPRAAAALAALDSVPEIVAPEIVGPVTKEIIGGRELERSTMHFRFVRATSRAR